MCTRMYSTHMCEVSCSVQRSQAYPSIYVGFARAHGYEIWWSIDGHGTLDREACARKMLKTIT